MKNNSKKGNFTIVDNTILRNKALSSKARFVFVMIKSLPPTWKANEKGLSSFFGIGLSTLKTGLRELEELGYLVRHEVKNEKGRFDHMEYILIDNPSKSQTKPKSSNDNCTPAEAASVVSSQITTADSTTKSLSAGNTPTENPSAENPSTDSPIHINTDPVNTNLKEYNNNPDVTVTPRDTEAVGSADTDYQQVQLLFPDLDERDVRILLKTADNNVEKIKQAKLVLVSTRSTIRSVMGFLITAIKGNYKIASSSPAMQTTFNDFPQRNYDVAFLEKLNNKMLSYA